MREPVGVRFPGAPSSRRSNPRANETLETVTQDHAPGELPVKRDRLEVWTRPPFPVTSTTWSAPTPPIPYPVVVLLSMSMKILTRASGDRYGSRVGPV